MVKRTIVAVTALSGWFGPMLQFPITMATSRAAGMTVIGAIVAYFSFFTILTNLLAATGVTFSLRTRGSAHCTCKEEIRLFQVCEGLVVMRHCLRSETSRAV